MVNETRMEEQLTLHEGLRLKAYKDTENNWTIGIGYNISGRGLGALQDVVKRPLGPRERAATDAEIEALSITKAEAIRMLKVDIARVQQAVQVYSADYNDLNEVRQRVVVDLAFNMGFGLAGFKKFIAAVKARNWSAAAMELYRSKWATQVGDGEGGKFDRADRLAKMILTGSDFTA